MKKIGIFSTHAFEKAYLKKAINKGYEPVWIDQALSTDTASLAKDCFAVAVFTSDDVSRPVLELLKKQAVGFVATRSAGYDHIDLKAAQLLGIKVANVPEYSPNSIAEHAVAMMLALNRKLVKADKKIKENNFTIDDLVGFNLYQKTVGIIGTGRIGSVVCSILSGFGCRLLAYDIKEDDTLIKKYNVQYVSLDQLCTQSDIISLHAPLNENTSYLINSKTIELMKEGVMLINTSRGKLLNTEDVYAALKTGKIGYFGMDVYENEKGIFFHDFTGTGTGDLLLDKLIKMENVLTTAHQAFLTREALTNIADTTLDNIRCYDKETPMPFLLND